jgi:hypothetical protein
MVSRFEWLEPNVDPGEPNVGQAETVIAALGDWIEAHLEYVAFVGQKVGNHTWAEIQAVLTEAETKQKAAKADAKRRAIEAGYVWRLDLDP